MRRRLLFLLVSQGYQPEDAANIVGILMTDAYLGPLIAGDPPQTLGQNSSMQEIEKGIFYFAPRT